MILTVFGVIQLIFIQIVSAQISVRDFASQNVLNNLANKPLVEYGRSTRQINNPPVDLPGNGPRTGVANNLPLRDGMPFGKFPRSNELPRNFALNNGLPNSAFNHGLPNNSPISSFDFPFPNMNIMPQNRLLPNINGNNGLPNFNNVVNGLPGFNNVPNGLPGLNIVPKGLPGLNNVPNGLPGLNNVPKGLPGLNNVPKGLPGLNNVPNGLPGLNNVPNRLPSFNNVPNGLPGLNSLPNGLPIFNNLPVTNTFQNLINVPAGNNILNLNNLPAAKPLPNSNVPNLNGMPSFNNLPCGNALPSVPTLPLNNLPSGNILPPFNNRTPFLNNFRITEIGIGNGIADIKRLPRNYQLGDNVLSVNANNLQNVNANNLQNVNANNLQNVNALTQQVYDELSNMNINGFSEILGSEVSNNAPTINRFFSVNNFPNGNGINDFAGEALPINTIHLSNDISDSTNFRNYNVMSVREQRFVNDDGFAVANQIPANKAMPNINSRLLNAINNGMLSNGGQLDEMLLANNEMRVSMAEKHVQNTDSKGFSRNFQFDNVQVPENNWHYEIVGSTVPSSQNIQPEGVQMFSNVPSDYQIGLTSNSLSLAQDLAKHLQMDGLANIPFLNGLPVAGITETVTVLNAPYTE